MGGGSHADLQARYAVESYNAVRGDIDPRLANIALTGHSLGGGLAGLVATLHGKTGVIFDHMPFEAAALSTYVNSLTSPTEVRDLVYGGQEPWFGNTAGLSGYAVEGEILGNLRALLPTVTPTTMHTFGANFPEAPAGAAVNRHSQALARAGGSRPGHKPG